MGWGPKDWLLGPGRSPGSASMVMKAGSQGNDLRGLKAAGLLVGGTGVLGWLAWSETPQCWFQLLLGGS